MEELYVDSRLKSSELGTSVFSWTPRGPHWIDPESHLPRKFPPSGMCGGARALALLVLLAAAAAAEDDRPVAAAAAAAAGGGRRAAVAPTPRWFLGGRTVTRVLLKQEVVTKHTPSSCVVVATSLPPCRSMRALSQQPDVQPAPPVQVLATEPAQLPPPEAGSGGGGGPEARTLGRGWTRSEGAPLLVSSEATPALQTQQLQPVDESGWNWNLFGSDVTVTNVLRQVKTLKKPDPNLMVTFSVTGCQPSSLPFDMDYCDRVPRVEVLKGASP